MSRDFVRCALFAGAAVLVCLVLGVAHVWRDLSHPASEPFNKGEWSIVQSLQVRSKGTRFPDAVVTMPNVFGSPDHDAIALPRLDGQGVVWALSNAQGIPRLKLLPAAALRHICEEEFRRIKAAVRLNTDVEALLRSLTDPDCKT